jgi:hypothetical protein
MFEYIWRKFHVSFAPSDEEFLEPEPTVTEEEEEQEDVTIELVNYVAEIDIDDEEQQETSVYSKSNGRFHISQQTPGRKRTRMPNTNSRLPAYEGDPEQHVSIVGKVSFRSRQEGWSRSSYRGS